MTFQHSAAPQSPASPPAPPPPSSIRLRPKTSLPRPSIPPRPPHESRSPETHSQNPAAQNPPRPPPRDSYPPYSPLAKSASLKSANAAPLPRPTASNPPAHS